MDVTPPDVTLVAGGARSGKSAFAQRLVEQSRLPRIFLATAEARDDEMRARIARHQSDRDDSWRTVEEPLELSAVLEQEAASGRAILVDCLSLWLSNILIADRDIDEEIERLAALLRSWKGGSLVLVSNEVGQGIVPDNALAREFRDHAGRLNQAVAAAATTVWRVDFGIPQQLKGGPAK